MPTPKTEKEVCGFFAKLNYISIFISHLTATCRLIFKLLQKDQAIKWNKDFQGEFDKIKQYLQKNIDPDFTYARETFQYILDSTR